MELTEKQIGFKKILKQMILNEDAEISFPDLELKAFQLAQIIAGDLTNSDVAEIVISLTEELTVTLSPGGTVVDPETFEPWIQERKETTPTPRWDAYEQLLISRDWESPVIKDLSKQSDEIVELLGDPLKSGSWARRGLLMGEVQSGKTANYIGVLNKALDYGYKVLIVIGGHTNELRTQTQSRFDTDLLGIDSEYLDDNIANATLPRIGIGEIDKSLRANVMTTVRGDFNSNKKTAGITWINSDLPTVFIIKKNARLIANVANYIRQQAGSEKIDVPLIVVDDESDWGTPNTGSETDPTRVNKEIRRLLDSSRRSSYLGITATPFANIFIDHNATDDEIGSDLFPQDYIRTLPAPSNYFGISQYFTPSHGALRLDVSDCTDLLPIIHKSNHKLHKLPESLRKAFLSFLLGTSIRRIRKKDKSAASMLVNVSRFNAIQADVASLLEELLFEITATVKSEFKRNHTTRSASYQEIYDLWEEEFEYLDEYKWNTIQSKLFEIIDEFKIELVNSKTASIRNKKRKLLTSEQRREEDLLPTIYVGGDVLSRGITLDGLQVSYFVREPRTMDTLMQMGRWFGYRPGYADLVRVWLPDETASDFAWSAEVTQELKELLMEMRSRKLTPRQFGLRVRTHPEGFRIVAANKSKSTEVKLEGPVLWENCLKESHELSKSSFQRDTNLQAVKSLISEINTPIHSSKAVNEYYKLWQAVPLESIQEFFMKFRGHETDILFGTNKSEQLSVMFEAISEAKGSELWDVCLVSGRGSSYPVAENVSINLSFRNELRLVEEDKLKFQNRRVATSGNLSSSLSVEESAEFERFRELDEHWMNSSDQSATLAFISRPRLLIYLVTVESSDLKKQLFIADDYPLAAVAIAFPKLDPEEAIIAAQNARKYQVNTVWLSNYYAAQYEGDDIPFGDEEDY